MLLRQTRSSLLSCLPHSPLEKINIIQNKTWHKRRLLLGWAWRQSCPEARGIHRMTFKISFQDHYSLSLSKHCLWREIKYGWVFKWRKRQRLTDSVLLQRGNWICTSISCISHLFHSGMPGMWQVSNSPVKLLLHNKNLMASSLFLFRNLYFPFKSLVVLHASLLDKIPNFEKCPSGHFSFRDASEKRGSKYTGD